MGNLAPWRAPPQSQKGVEDGYVPLYPSLPCASPQDVISEELSDALRDVDAASALRSIARPEFEDVYSVRLLRPGVCAQLVEEAEAYRSWAQSCATGGRVTPGLLLSARWYLKQIDPLYEEFFCRLVSEVLAPLDAALYGSTSPLTYHHDYCICYDDRADRSLKPHTDDSDVTVNAYLGCCRGASRHEGADLLLLSPEDATGGTPRLGVDYRGEMRSYRHEEVGRAVIHPGDRWHAVQPLESGQRWNLLTWAFRNDAPWKAELYPEMGEYLRGKAESANAGGPDTGGSTAAPVTDVAAA